MILIPFQTVGARLATDLIAVAYKIPTLGMRITDEGDFASALPQSLGADASLKRRDDVAIFALGLFADRSFLTRGGFAFAFPRHGLTPGTR